MCIELIKSINNLPYYIIFAFKKCYVCLLSAALCKLIFVLQEDYLIVSILCPSI